MVHIKATSIRKAQPGGHHHANQPDYQRTPLPAVDKLRRAQFPGQLLGVRVGVVRLVCHSLRPSSLVPGS